MFWLLQKKRLKEEVLIKKLLPTLKENLMQKIVRLGIVLLVNCDTILSTQFNKGKSFGSDIFYEQQHCIYFYRGKTGVLLWKAS
jgi:hypothetical protein